MNQARAILRVQWLTLRRLYPRAGVAWTALLATMWYGAWGFFALLVARAVADPEGAQSTAAVLPGALMLAFLYWQVVPLMLASTGASLDLRKLLAYPIPPGQFFVLEVLLRATAAIEMALMMTGLAAGILLNPRFPAWGVAGVVLFVAFNLLLAAGIRDVVERILARKRVREVAFFALILLVTLPQFLVRNVDLGDSPRPQPSGRFRAMVGSTVWIGWPWTAAGNLMHGADVARSSAILAMWCVLAGVFARWQFSRSLAFDKDAARAGGEGRRWFGRLSEGLYRLPSAIFRDPLGALVEKEFRFLSRAPRFRLMFLMGFTFGLIIWLPVVFGRDGAPSVLSRHALTVVSVYSILLLSEVCFWNTFGFDRSAAQVYFLAPVEFSRVLMAKNIAGLWFVALEIALVAGVCALFRLPVGLGALGEAYAVAAVISVFLLAAGNLLSIHQARGTDPSKSFRGGSTGRVQAILFLVYPVVFAPAGLAFLAEYAFDSRAAFYGVLAADFGIALVFYKIALDSAVEAAGRLKEKIVAALSEGSGPIAA